MGGDAEEKGVFQLGGHEGHLARMTGSLHLGSLPSLLCHTVVLALIIPKFSSGFF